MSKRDKKAAMINYADSFLMIEVSAVKDKNIADRSSNVRPSVT